MALPGTTRLGLGSPINRPNDYTLFDTKDLTGTTIQGMNEDDFYRRRRLLKRIRTFGHDRVR